MENNFIANIQYLIEFYELKQVCRRQDIIYKRYFLYDQLRKANYSLSAIGRIFDKNHASVLHGIRMHNVYTKSKDKVYKMYTADIVKRLITIPQEASIKEAVLNADNWDEIVQIKLQITEGYF
jgi:hypothetical protein